MMTQDELYMGKAIDLAEKGLYTTTPNPRVGCLIVDSNNHIVGEGAHLYAGSDHAEVIALKQAGSLAKGSTVYVTLEPCAHFGRTPPCINALIEAKVARVVIGSLDSNPKVAGKGLAALHQAGIDVLDGVLEKACINLNKGFLKRMQTNMPYVRLKVAISLDGRIAMKSGDSQWITNELSRQDVQYLRAQSCAIISSSRTVIQDNARLTVRLKNFKRQPLRVVLDKSLNLDSSLSLFSQQGEILIFHHSDNLEKIKLLSSYATLVYTPVVENYLDLKFIMHYLGDKEQNEVLVESGGILLGSFLAQNLVDELIVYQAPIVIGHEGKPAFCLSSLEKLSQAYSFNLHECSRIGDNMKWTLLSEVI